MVEQLEEDPLRPFVVGRIAGFDLPVPIVGKSEFSNWPRYRLIFSAVAFAGWNLPIGVLFGGEAEGIIPHGVQHVKTLLGV